VGILILVCSTTGNGEAPDNASKFWRKLRLKKDANWMQNVQFSVLGLGDQNYDQFCAMGKNLDRTIKKNGATPFVESAFADEAVGLDAVVEPWRNQVLKALGEKFASGLVCESSSETKEEINVLNRTVDPREVDGVPRWRKPNVSAKFLSSENRMRRRSGEEVYSSRFKITDTEMVLRGYTPETPFLSELKAAKFLTSEDSIRQVIHVELDLPFENRGITYQVGDSIGIYCPNDWELVENLLKRLNVSGDLEIQFDGDSHKQLPHIHTPCTIRDAFLFCVDLQAVPQKALLRMLGEYCLNEEERQALYFLAGKTKQSRQKYEDDIVKKKPTLLELLHLFPSCYPNLMHLLENLSPLSPRYYSVSSSPALHPTSLHIALTVVRYEIDGVQRKGLCSSWLYDLCVHEKLLPARASLGGSSGRIDGAARRSEKSKIAVPVFIRKGKEFTLPIDSTKPIVMIGPGTGVAPFRAFAQHRKIQCNALKNGGACVGMWRGFELELDAKDDETSDTEIPRWGKALLFFGCRKKSWDYLYGEEFEELELDRALDEFCVAFSREVEGRKVYVQDLLREKAQEIYEIVCELKGYVFVCGDVSGMTKDVQNVFAEIIREKGNMTEEEAKKTVTQMIIDKRYVQDIWN
jgi:sulfite reductase alpha subunit-like flavoprotein